MSPLLSFTFDRDKTLGIDFESTAKRVEKNRNSGVKDEIEKISTIVAEGHAMTDGTNFMSGMHLAQYTNNAIEFAIAALQEKGFIGKKLLKKSKAENGDKPGGYL